MLALTKATPASRQIEQWRQAESWYQRSVNLWLDLRNRGVVSQADAKESDKVGQELQKSKTALSKLQN